MLEKLTGWLRDQILAIWHAFTGFMADFLLMWVEHSCHQIVIVLGMLPAPSFLTQHSIGELLGSAGPTVGWLVATFRVGESMAMISAAMVFYVVRRLLTLGIW